MKRASILALLMLVCLALRASVGPAPGRAPMADLGCDPLRGAETLTGLQGPLVVDGQPDELVAPALALLCALAQSGQTLLLVATSEAAPAAGMEAERLAQLGARVRFQALRAQAAADAARADALAAELDAVRTGEAQARLFVIAPAPLGARSALGLSGDTWRPLGLRLAGAETIVLRVERGWTPGARVTLRAFEDVPRIGAAARYDGLIEIGAEPASNVQIDP